MRVLLFLLSFILSGHLFTSCSQKNNKTPDQLSASHIVKDTTDFAVIDFDQNHDWPFKHTYKSATLSYSEIQLLDSLLRHCISNYNQKLSPNLKSSYSIDFVKFKYKRQYMAVVNDKGQKEVWVNGFCDTWNNNWKSEIMLVKDGGNCYFNLKINLTTKECFEVSVNGYA